MHQNPFTMQHPLIYPADAGSALAQRMFAPHFIPFVGSADPIERQVFARRAQLDLLSGVVGGQYGDASNIPQITVDPWGRITRIATVTATGGSGSPDDSSTVVAARVFRAGVSIWSNQVCDFAEAVQDAFAAARGTTQTIILNYNDSTNTITADAITQMSVTQDVGGIKLSGDSASPGNSKYYGTDAAGTKGWNSHTDDAGVVLASRVFGKHESYPLSPIDDAGTVLASRVFGKHEGLNLSEGATGTLPSSVGGTGQSTYTRGDMLYGNVNHGLSIRGPNGSVPRYWANTGSSLEPQWDQVELDTGGVSGTLPSGNGGTASSKFAVTGPATTTKTFTFPDASATVLTDNAAVTVPQGGTNKASFTAYAVICGGTTTTGALQSVAALGSSGDVLTSNGAGALPTFQTPSTTAAASQSDQETATNTTKFVAPATQHYHPGHAKVVGLAKVSAAVPTLQTTDKFGTSSITDTATGRLTVSFTTNFSDTLYMPMCSVELDSTAHRIVAVEQGTRAQGSIVFRDQNGSNTLNDPDAWHWAIFGDQ